MPAVEPALVPAALSPGPVINQRLVVWDEAGNPLVTTAPLITKRQLTDLYMAAAAQPFVCEDPLNPDFIYNGLSCAEVMIRKQMLLAAQTGNAEAVMDRLLGRPTQSVESKRLVMTYEEALREIGRKANLNPAPPIPTTASPSSYDEDPFDIDPSGEVDPATGLQE